MARFSATDAAFAGFGLIRRRPGAVTWWAAALLIFQLVAGGLALIFAGDALTQMRDASVQPAAALRLAPLLLLFIPLVLAVYAALYSAAVRTFLAPEPLRFGGLRFGADELRLIGAILLMVLIVIAADIGAALVAIGATLLIGLLTAVTVHAPLGWVSVFHWLALLCVGVTEALVVVRLSLTVVTTVAERRIGLRRSWTLTKGHFWPLLGAYLLMAVLSLIVFLVLLALGAAIFAVLPMDGGFAERMRVMRFWPGAGAGILVWAAWIVMRLVGLWLTAAWHAVALGPAAQAYQAFSAPETPVEA